MTGIIEVLQKHAVPFLESGHHHCTEGWVQIDCPWCSRNSGKFRMGLSLSSRATSCWTCGPQKLAETLVELTGLSYKEILEDINSIRATNQLIQRHTGKLVLPDGIGPLRSAHCKYLQGRGFDPDEVSTLWGVRGIGPHPRLGWRLFIPVTFSGRTVSWTTRAVSPNATQRYIGAGRAQEAIPKSTLLYGEDLADGHAVIVCEGPLDAIKIGPGGLSTCGAAFTKVQAMRLARYPYRIVCFDADQAGQNRARKLCDTVSGFPGVTKNIVLETGKDPSRCDGKELSELRRLLH